MNRKLLSFYDPNVNTEFFSLPLSRQTASKDCNLGEYRYCFNNMDAEWQIVGTWINDISKIKGKKIIYLQQEPPEIRLPTKQILDDCTLAVTFFNIDHSIRQFLAPPTLQWTYDISAKMVPQKGHVYKKINDKNLQDFLFSPVPKKKKNCSIIVSTKIMTEGHKKRLLFVNELQKAFEGRIDFFGFGFNPIDNKRDAIDPYHFSIALENANINNWFTEKITDIFLGYTCPIYYGCPNINNFFDSASFISINIDKLDESFEIIDKAINNVQIIKIRNIIEARRTVLLDYNMLSIINSAIDDYDNSINRIL